MQLANEWMNKLLYLQDLGTITVEQQNQMLETITSNVDEFLATTLQAVQEQFAPLIEIAQKAQEIMEAARDAINQIRLSAPDAIVSPRQKVELIQLDIAKQQELLRSGTEEEKLAAGQKLIQLYQDLLAKAGEAFDQSGPQFQGIYQQVIAGLQEVQTITDENFQSLEEITADMNAAIKDAKDQAAAFYATILEQTTTIGNAQVTELQTLASQLLGPVGRGARQTARQGYLAGTDE